MFPFVFGGEIYSSHLSLLKMFLPFQTDLRTSHCFFVAIIEYWNKANTTQLRSLLPYNLIEFPIIVTELYNPVQYIDTLDTGRKKNNYLCMSHFPFSFHFSKLHSLFANYIYYEQTLSDDFTARNGFVSSDKHLEDKLVACVCGCPCRQGVGNFWENLIKLIASWTFTENSKL